VKRSIATLPQKAGHGHSSLWYIHRSYVPEYFSHFALTTATGYKHFQFVDIHVYSEERTKEKITLPKQKDD